MATSVDDVVVAIQQTALPSRISALQSVPRPAHSFTERESIRKALEAVELIARKAWVQFIVPAMFAVDDVEAARCLLGRRHMIEQELQQLEAEYRGPVPLAYQKDLAHILGESKRGSRFVPPVAVGEVLRSIENDPVFISDAQSALFLSSIRGVVRSAMDSQEDNCIAALFAHTLLAVHVGRKCGVFDVQILECRLLAIAILLTPTFVLANRFICHPTKIWTPAAVLKASWAFQRSRSGLVATKVELEVWRLLFRADAYLYERSAVGVGLLNVFAAVVGSRSEHDVVLASVLPRHCDAEPESVTSSKRSLLPVPARASKRSKVDAALSSTAVVAAAGASCASSAVSQRNHPDLCESVGLDEDHGNDLQGRENWCESEDLQEDVALFRKHFAGQASSVSATVRATPIVQQVVVLGRLVSFVARGFRQPEIISRLNDSNLDLGFRTCDAATVTPASAADILSSNCLFRGVGPNRFAVELRRAVPVDGELLAFQVLGCTEPVKFVSVSTVANAPSKIAGHYARTMLTTNPSAVCLALLKSLFPINDVWAAVRWQAVGRSCTDVATDTLTYSLVLGRGAVMDDHIALNGFGVLLQVASGKVLCSIAVAASQSDADYFAALTLLFDRGASTRSAFTFKTVELNAGDVLYLVPGQVHAFFAKEDAVVTGTYVLPPALVPRAIKTWFASRRLSRMFEGDGHVASSRTSMSSALVLVVCRQLMHVFDPALQFMMDGDRAGILAAEDVEAMVLLVTGVLFLARVREFGQTISRDALYVERVTKGALGSFLPWWSGKGGALRTALITKTLLDDPDITLGRAGILQARVVATAEACDDVLGTDGQSAVEYLLKWGSQFARLTVP